MPRLEYFLVAESVSIDQQTNSASIFHVLEEFRAPSFPLLIPRVAAIAAWEISPEEIGSEHSALLKVSGPVPPNLELRVNITLSNIRHRVMLRIQGLVVAGPGTVEFELRFDDEHAASHTVTVLHEAPGDNDD